MRQLKQGSQYDGVFFFYDVVFFAAPAAKFLKLYISCTWSKHLRFFWRFFNVAELPQKEKCLNTQEFTNFLSTSLAFCGWHWSGHWWCLEALFTAD